MYLLLSLGISATASSNKGLVLLVCILNPDTSRLHLGCDLFLGLSGRLAGSGILGEVIGADATDANGTEECL